MTKKSIKAEVNNFVGGLVTEASPLNFPPNATVDELNFVLNRDGTRDRRFGMDLEQGYNLISTGTTTAEIAENAPVPFKWMNVEGSAETNILVVQTNSSLVFFDLDQEIITSVSALGGIDLSPYGFSASVRYSFTVVNGKLIVAAGVSSIVIVSYNGTTFSSTAETLKTRDIWGLEVAVEPGYENDILYRGELPAAHSYNLYNQSWGIPRRNNIGGGINNSDPIYVYKEGTGKHPSNSEVVWTGLKYQPVTSGADPYEQMYPDLYEQAFGANVKAAKGYFIIDLLRRGSSRDSAIAANKAKHPEMIFGSLSTVADITEGGAKVICEFAGRVWYAGFDGKVIDGDARSPALSSYVAFSQLVRNKNDIVKCYQEGDPTSRDNNDLVDTDGGLIRLSGAEGIIGMIASGSSLIVFAANGVWAITGGDRNGFTATNYKVDHLTTFGAISPLSIVSDGSRALYWAADGIYVVDKNQLGDLVVNNLIQKSIQSYYEDIPLTSKQKAIGVFEAAGKKIRWLYHEGERFTSTSITRELVLDLTLGAFYPFKIGNVNTYSVEAVSMFAANPFNAALVDDVVLVDEDVVLVDSDTVAVESIGRTSGLLDTRYLAVVLVEGMPYITFAYYNNNRFLDWESHNGVGVDAAAFLTTGAVTANDSSVTKQVPYLTLHFLRTEQGVDADLNPLSQSSCLVRSQWDWANSSNSNKWGSLFQGYRQRREYFAVDEDDAYDTGFQVVTSKSKLRGRGRAFALHMETEAGKDCRILGWSIAINGNPV
jgi:hypothetical protein